VQSERHIQRDAMFDRYTHEQRAAIAADVEVLPRLVNLQHEDAPRIQRAIRDCWGRFLPRP
jgi:hypothetical protein